MQTRIADMEAKAAAATQQLEGLKLELRRLGTRNAMLEFARQNCVESQQG